MGHAELEGKDTSGKGEGLIVQITYKRGRGKMTVNVPELLRMRQISRYRKLMTLIRQSDTPDAAEEVIQYIRQELADMDARMKEAAAGTVRTRTQAKGMKLEIDRLVALRDRYKKGTDRYKECSQWVKDARQIHRDLGKLSRSYEAEFKALQKGRKFYQKAIAEEDKR